MEPEEALQAVQGVLTDELRRPRWRGHPNPLAGHCYVATEALWHLLGGRESGWKPYVATWDDTTHWWLQDETGAVLDPTASQFTEDFPYEKGRCCGFLTLAPSSRAQQVLIRIRLEEAHEIREEEPP